MEEATLETLSGVKKKAVKRPSLLKVILPNMCAPTLARSHIDAATKAAGKCTQRLIISRLVQSCRMMQFERHNSVSPTRDKVESYRKQQETTLAAK